MKPSKPAKPDPSVPDRIMSDLDLFLFGEGRHWKLYDKLGAHPMTLNGQQGVGFAVWAPNAQGVSVIGDFNYWDGSANRLHRNGNSGVWEGFVAGLSAGTLYKFRIFNHDGHALPTRTIRSVSSSSCARAPPQSSPTSMDTSGTIRRGWKAARNGRRWTRR